MGKRKLEDKGDQEMLEGSNRKKAHIVTSRASEEEEEVPINQGKEALTKEEDSSDLKGKIDSVLSNIHKKLEESQAGKETSTEGDIKTDAPAANSKEESDSSNKEENKVTEDKKVEEKVSEEAKSESAHPVIDVDQPRLTDVLLIEHAVKNLQTSIDSILQSSPDNNGLKRMQNSITDETNPQLTAALQRYKMRLGAQLKTMYNEGELKIFDQILQFEEITDALEAPKPLKFTAQFTPDDSGSSVTSSASSSTTSSFVANQNKDLPPIPEIKDPAIRARVFIHKSLIKDKLYLSKKEQLHSHNERLEFLGDSVLNNMMTQIAYHRFPDAAEGYLSILRTKLISNATLMKWSSAYGLDKELKKNTSEETLGHGKMKLYADVFEAYIGGLMTEDPSNYPVVYEWLKQLAEPILSLNEPKKETRSEFRANAKMELYSLIGSASLGLHYECVERDQTVQPTKFVVELRTGAKDVLGKGEGENIKIAGTKAAMQALDDKELIEKYSLIRANTPRDTSKLPSTELNRLKSRETASISSRDSSVSSNGTSPGIGSNQNTGNRQYPSKFSKPSGPSGPSSEKRGNPRRDTRGTFGNNNRGGRFQRGGHFNNNSRGRGRERNYGDRF
ncbi:Ribonuclease 3 [Wickerhamomyces ciferrii]|uniref:ribonuclease III n=1 Tax=Wickerhamomyces ciferrii (strain ATCC 14091 / BCRC 22168 / CBS 111 / JCM 3599 / NBRC 0793 / NRRL Y-1031 F-60-10) TaxID=1206466 RepID=K0KG02_WICCF|nr:Ribonuclease 3 [Wickerhamomyces ciferrii]CCH44085.1 Ribonuclease 3 [Wickerhamomyces ciferrii]